MRDETELLDSDDYYCRPEFREEDEQPTKPTKPAEQDDAPAHTLKGKRQRLQKIAADETISYSDRQDAKRILEYYESHSKEFDRGFSELTARIEKEKRK